MRDILGNKSNNGCQISGVPKEHIREVVRELRLKGAYVFATSLVDDFYESFGDCWEVFVKAMETE
jgi:hypothetical protein